MQSRVILSTTLGSMLLAHLFGCNSASFGGSTTAGAGNPQVTTGNALGTTTVAAQTGSAQTLATPIAAATTTVGSGSGVATTAAAQIPPNSKIVIPPSCGAAGATQVNLLSPSITNGDPNNFLKYQLFVTDCSGKLQPLTAAQIDFYCDASFATPYGQLPPALTYSVTDGTNQISGSMPFVPAQQGGYAEYVNQTDQPVTFAANGSSVTLTIYEHGLTVTPDNNPNQLTC